MIIDTWQMIRREKKVGRAMRAHTSSLSYMSYGSEHTSKSNSKPAPNERSELNWALSTAKQLAAGQLMNTNVVQMLANLDSTVPSSKQSKHEKSKKKKEFGKVWEKKGNKRCNKWMKQHWNSSNAYSTVTQGHDLFIFFFSFLFLLVWGGKQNVGQASGMFSETPSCSCKLHSC